MNDKDKGKRSQETEKSLIFGEKCVVQGLCSDLLPVQHCASSKKYKKQQSPGHMVSKTWKQTEFKTNISSKEMTP